MNQWIELDPETGVKQWLLLRDDKIYAAEIDGVWYQLVWFGGFDKPMFTAAPGTDSPPPGPCTLRELHQLHDR